MRRVVVPLALVATIVIAWWRLWPTSAGARLGATASSADQSTVAVVAQIDTELDRLQTRVPPADRLGPPDRNPFRFGASPAAPTPAPVAPAPLPPAPVAPTLPKLVAITSKTTPGGVVRTAALSTRDGVVLANPGDRIGTLVVQTIADGFVEFVDPASGLAYRVR